MGAGAHGGGFVSLTECAGGGQISGKLLRDELKPFTHLEDLSGIHDILRRRAEMDVRAMSAAQDFESPDHRNQRVTGLCHLATQIIKIEVGGCGVLLDHIGSSARDEAAVGLSLSERRFDIEPGLQRCLVAEDGAHFAIAKKVAVETGINSASESFSHCFGPKAGPHRVRRRHRRGPVAG